MNNEWDELYRSPYPVCDSYQTFNLTVNIYQNKYTFYVKNQMITNYIDNSDPYLSGSVGLRGYITTALYSNVCIDFLQ